MQSALQAKGVFSVYFCGLIFGEGCSQVLLSCIALWQNNNIMPLRDKSYICRTNSSRLLLLPIFWMSFAIYFKLYLPGFNANISLHDFFFFFPQFFTFLYKLGEVLCYPVLRSRLYLLDCSTGSLSGAPSNSQ